MIITEARRRDASLHMCSFSLSISDHMDLQSVRLMQLQYHRRRKPGRTAFFQREGAKTHLVARAGNQGKSHQASGVIGIAPRQDEGEKALGNHSTDHMPARSRSTCCGSNRHGRTCSDLEQTGLSKVPNTFFVAWHFMLNSWTAKPISLTSATASD